MTRQTSRNRSWQPAALALAGAAAAFCAGGAQAQETFKIGIVSFLSGQAAESFGIPAVNGAKVLVDAFNKGAAPAPYNKIGFGGMKIEAVYVDENGGATKQVQELRNLYDREKVDAVVGYVGSGDCLAVAPVGRGDEELPHPLRLRHAAHLRGQQAAVRVPHRVARDHGQRRPGALPEGAQRQGRDLQHDQPGLRLGPGLEEGLHPVDGEALPRRQAGRGPAAQVRRRPVRHRDLGADGQAGRRHALQPVGRRPAGLHPAGRRRAVCSSARRSCFSAADHVLPGLGDKMPERRDPRRARRLRPDVAEVGAQRLVVGSLLEGLQRLPGAGAVPHGRSRCSA